jgi:hypothetical protein
LSQQAKEEPSTKTGTPKKTPETSTLGGLHAPPVQPAQNPRKAISPLDYGSEEDILTQEELEKILASYSRGPLEKRPTLERPVATVLPGKMVSFIIFSPRIKFV